MKSFLIVLATVVGLGIIAMIFIYSGAYNPSALSSDSGIIEGILVSTRNAGIETRAEEVEPPALNDTAMIREGFEHYNEMCVVCHGAPGVKESEAAEGLNPQPPDLFESKNIMEPKETFWVVKNGIRMTGMPSFGATHSDEKIWAITAFVTQKLATMTPAEYKAWQDQYGVEEE